MGKCICVLAICLSLSLSLCFRDISSDNSALQCRLSQVITSRLRAYDSRLRATSRTRVRVINESGARSRSAFPSKRRSEKDGSIWCTARIIRRVNDAAASVGDKQKRRNSPTRGADRRGHTVCLERPRLSACPRTDPKNRDRTKKHFGKVAVKGLPHFRAL